VEKFLLKLLDLFAWAFRSIKIDYDQLRAIVATKLTMDNRRQLVAYKRRTKKEPSNTFGFTLFFYAIFGGFVSLAMYNIPSFILSMIVFFTYIMVMVSMTLITDFSSILLDTSDNTIILPRPVDSRTLFAARLTHILLYLGQLAIGLSIIPAVVVMVQYGVLLFFVFWTAVGLSILTAVILTNALYLLIMQFASEEKLKSVINYFQIVMAIFIMAGYQVLPRMIERIDMKSFVFEIQWWSFLLPPVWMAGTMEAIQFKLMDNLHIGLLASALILPLIGVYVVNKHLSPLFNRKIASLGGGVRERVNEKTQKNNLLTTIAKWITTTPSERGIFEVIYKILGRDRKIKLKIYPAFGYVAVFGLIFMMRSQEDFATTWANLPNTQYHLMLLYLIFMVLQVALYEIPYSDDFRASWIYYSTPLKNPGEILSGTIKAICVRLFFPSYCIISAFVLYVWGYHAIDDIIIALFNNFLMLIILAMINKRHLPLSMAPDVRAQSGNIMRSILTFVLIGTLGLAHFLLTLLRQHSNFLLGMIPIQVIALYLIFRAYKRTTWNQITL
jgi:ABC-2 type transport system permease protein